MEEMICGRDIEDGGRGGRRLDEKATGHYRIVKRICAEYRRPIKRLVRNLIREVEGRTGEGGYRPMGRKARVDRLAAREVQQKCNCSVWGRIQRVSENVEAVLCRLDTPALPLLPPLEVASRAPTLAQRDVETPEQRQQLRTTSEVLLPVIALIGCRVVCDSEVTKLV